jgi:tetratricopeptide (TPR) repeat protein
MEALLAALERRTVVRVGRVVAVAVVVATAGGAWMLARGADPCAPTGRELAGAWDEDVRSRATEAFGRLDVPYAAATWRRVDAELDHYAERWEAARREGCEASVVRHDRSAEAHDLATACLHARRDALAALTDVLAQADDTVAEQSVVAVRELPSVEDCGSPERLRTWGLLVPDPDTRALVVGLRNAFSVVRAQLQLGRPRIAAAMLPPWLAHANALDVPHLRAEALDLQGRVAQANGAPQDAKRAFEDALQEAARAGDDRYAAEIWPRLVFLVGDTIGDADVATTYELPARLALSRIGDDPLLVLELEHALGSTYATADRLELAEEHHLRALAIRREQTPDDALAIADSMNRLAHVQVKRRNAAESVATLEEVRRLNLEALAPDHPRLAAIEFNLGQALSVAGRMEESVVHLRAAVDIQQAALGPGHPKTVNALAMLGTILGQSGHVQEGIVVAEQALAALADRPDHPQLPMILNNLGGLYHEAGRLEDSLAAHERALAVLESRGKQESAVYAMNMSNLALMQTALGRHESAEANFLRAIAVYERLYGSDHPQLWRPNAMLARLYRTTDRPTTALPYAERAVAVLAGATSDPNEIADADFELAQVRWDAGRRDAETLALARRARDRWREIELGKHADVVDAWLAERE